MIPQRRGTAPGLICPVGQKVVYAVPGVPYEMAEMFDRGIRPYFDVRFVVDDRPSVVEMWRANGLSVLAVTDPGIPPRFFA